MDTETPSISRAVVGVVPATNPEVAGKSPYEVRDQYLEVRVERFCRRVARAIFEAVRGTASCGHGAIEEVRDIDHLNALGVVPFTVAARFAPVTWSYLLSKRQHMDDFRKGIYWCFRAARWRDCMVVIPVERQLAAIHNIRSLNVSGRRFSLLDPDGTVLYLDALDPLLNALIASSERVAGQGSDGVIPAGDAGSALPHRFARLSGTILNLVGRLHKRHFRLYATMCLHADYRTRVLHLGQKKLAELAGLHQSFVPRGIRKLAQLGLVEIRTGTHRHCYSLPLTDGQELAFLDLPERVVASSAAFGVREWRVLIALVRRAVFSDEGRVSVSQQELEKMTGVHRTHLPRAIAALEGSGVVLVEHPGRGRRNIYWAPKRERGDRARQHAPGKSSLWASPEDEDTVNRMLQELDRLHAEVREAKDGANGQV